MVIEGKLHAKFDTQQVTDTFKKREFVIEYAENPLYPQFIKFELIQDRTGLVDAFNPGEHIEVQFNLKGREWTNPEGQKLYFTTLDAWRIQRLQASTPAPQGQAAASGQPVYDVPSDISADDADDLPF